MELTLFIPFPMLMIIKNYRHLVNNFFLPKEGTSQFDGKILEFISRTFFEIFENFDC